MGFDSDLKYSYKANVLNAYYKYSGFKYIQVITDLETQKKGIDKVLYYGKDKRVTIDEKSGFSKSFETASTYLLSVSLIGLPICRTLKSSR